MLDQLRRDLTTRLDELLTEADKLRRALTALGTRQSNRAPSAPPVPKARATRARATSTAAGRNRTKTPTATGNSRARDERSTKATAAPHALKRTPPGATQSAVLTALATGDAMTANEIAGMTGLGRATISTTLSRLAKTGELAKVTRGYQIAKPASDAAGGTSSAT
jgi:biotin operon repressor